MAQAHQIAGQPQDVRAVQRDREPEHYSPARRRGAEQAQTDPDHRCLRQGSRRGSPGRQGRRTIAAHGRAYAPRPQARTVASGAVGILNRNPADAVDPPKVEWKPVSTYDLPQSVDVIEAMRSKPIFVPVLLAILCGLRRGEICALRWRSVDLAGGQLSVVESLEQTKDGLRFKSPKSGKGRTVALSETVIAELRAYRAQRAQEMLRLGKGLSDDDLVLAHPDGSQITPIYISQQWARAIGKTTLAHLRFHDLRHAHATHMLANGVHPKVASERLGHSKVGITLDLYSHVIPGMQADAAATVDAALKAAAQNRNGSNPVAELPPRTKAE